MEWRFGCLFSSLVFLLTVGGVEIWLSFFVFGVLADSRWSGDFGCLFSSSVLSLTVGRVEIWLSVSVISVVADSGCSGE